MTVREIVADPIIRSILISYLFLATVTVSLDALLPLWLFTAVERGGLGFTVGHIFRTRATSQNGLLWPRIDCPDWRCVDGTGCAVHFRQPHRVSPASKTSGDCPSLPDCHGSVCFDDRYVASCESHRVSGARWSWGSSCEHPWDRHEARRGRDCNLQELSRRCFRVGS